MYLAAERLTGQVKQLGIFDTLIIVTERDLSNFAPWLFEWYSTEELETIPGYGFYAWKAGIAKAAVSGYWGDTEVVCYLDAGCEVLPGRRSKRLFSRWITKAQEFGAVGFSSFVPEWKYTKSEIVDLFPNSEKALNTDQFQSGTWLLGGTTGQDIAIEWEKLCRSSRTITDDKSRAEIPGFVAPRHDQSVFSMVLKKYFIQPENLPTPYPNGNFLASLSALRSPLWAARNRSGNTTIPRHVHMFARLLP
jgi:hypothetical protein